MLLFAMIATVVIFAGSLILLVVAAFLYIPLLCYIQGNLKEYVCHKVDKVSINTLEHLPPRLMSDTENIRIDQA
jgi:hypothetical protein